ncbi:MAG: TolB-like 6-bladed beta-propeller domain-containing protein [Bacteroidaceae bacterium]|nr:TolB-like 6-bladed beta-propeller domain-containing protein [Bacteroidaceae bacterium]
MKDADVLYCIDSLFIVHRTYYFDYPYDVYSIDTFDSITSFGRKGRARNEFVTSPINKTKQVFTRNGHSIMPLMDGADCKELNINKTIESKFPVIERVYDGIHYNSGTAILYGEDNNKMFAFYDGTADEMYKDRDKLPMIVYSFNDNIRKENIYLRYPSNASSIDDVSSFYSGVLFKKPDEDIVAQPLDRMGYILFYELDKCRYHAIHIKGARLFEDGLPDDEQELMLRSFLDDAVVTDDYLLVLYYGDGLKRLETDPEYKGQLLMFDWKGNLVKSFTLHDWVNRIALDVSSNVLYGSNFLTGEFYSFGELK